MESSALGILPLELRNRIYEFAVPRSEQIEVTSSLQPPALLQVCYETRTEASRIYFGQNTFDFIVESW